MRVGVLRGSPIVANLRGDAVLERAAADGWAYVELPERFSVRTDGEIANRIAALVHRLLSRGATVTDASARAQGMAGTRQQTLAPYTYWVLAVVFCQAQKVEFPGLFPTKPLPWP